MSLASTLLLVLAVGQVAQPPEPQRWPLGKLDDSGFVPFEDYRRPSPEEARAIARLRGRDYAEAAAMFGRLVEQNPNNLLAQKGYVEATNGQGQLPQLIARHAKSRPSSLSLGVNYALAEACVAQSYRHPANDAQAAELRGKARDHLYWCMQKTPHELPVVIAYAADNRRWSEPGKGRQMLERHLKANAHQYRVRYLLARAYADGVWRSQVREQGRDRFQEVKVPLEDRPEPDRSLLEISRILSEHPSYPYAHFTKGWVFATHLKRTSDAKAAFQRFLQFAPPRDGLVPWTKQWLSRHP